MVCILLLQLNLSSSPSLPSLVPIRHKISGQRWWQRQAPARAKRRRAAMRAEEWRTRRSRAHWTQSRGAKVSTFLVCCSFMACPGARASCSVKCVEEKPRSANLQTHLYSRVPQALIARWRRYAFGLCLESLDGWWRACVYVECTCFASLFWLGPNLDSWLNKNQTLSLGGSQRTRTSHPIFQKVVGVQPASWLGVKVVSKGKVRLPVAHIYSYEQTKQTNIVISILKI